MARQYITVKAFKGVNMLSEKRLNVFINTANAFHVTVIYIKRMLCKQHALTVTADTVARNIRRNNGFCFELSYRDASCEQIRYEIYR